MIIEKHYLVLYISSHKTSNKYFCNFGNRFLRWIKIPKRTHIGPIWSFMFDIDKTNLLLCRRIASHNFRLTRKCISSPVALHTLAPPNPTFRCSGDGRMPKSFTKFTALWGRAGFSMKKYSFISWCVNITRWYSFVWHQFLMKLTSCWWITWKMNKHKLKTMVTLCRCK